VPGRRWDTLYQQRNAAGVGWYEAVPATLPMLLEVADHPEARVVDVGAGASTLVDHLIAEPSPTSRL